MSEGNPGQYITLSANIVRPYVQLLTVIDRVHQGRTNVLPEVLECAEGAVAHVEQQYPILEHIAKETGESVAQLSEVLNDLRAPDTLTFNDEEVCIFVSPFIRNTAIPLRGVQ